MMGARSLSSIESRYFFDGEPLLRLLPVSEEDTHKAKLVVVGNAQSIDDAKELLAMLGLL
jgi:hypothetical protein